MKDKVENWKMRLETQEELVSQSIKGTGDPESCRKKITFNFLKDTPNESKSDHQEEEAKTSDREQVKANASVPTLSTAKVADSAIKPTSRESSHQKLGPLVAFRVCSR